MRGIQILAIKNTDDFQGKRAHIIFDIYDKLSGGKSLFPPAIGFILDREGRTEQVIEDLRKRSQNLVEFLPRRMYENYLLHPKAIVSVINEEDNILREKPLDTAYVEEWLKKKKQDRVFLPQNISNNKLCDSKWFCLVDGANLLNELFIEFSGGRVEFRKTKHSYKLTEWLIENQPDYLSELANFLTAVLPATFNHTSWS